ncbi:MAG: glycosyltransferase family 4 protein [Candidatus Thorarchaeota archaeon]|jgi:glycosyltransferase involved in cell wall biosynthesis
MTSTRKNIFCTLFFTRGVSLRTWDQLGMLDREVALYLQLRERGVKIGFVTYGNAGDLQYAHRFRGITILCNRWNLPPRLYERLLPLLHASWLRSSDVIKTNQVLGADIALKAARRRGKMFISRCGYLLSEFAEQQHGFNSDEAQQARSLEQNVFSSADRVVVTTPAMHHTVTQRYSLPRDRVNVIPNYVDTDAFLPASELRHSPGRICFIGRLEEQKNPVALLEAIEGLDVELVLVGNGPLRNRLQTEVESNGLMVRLLGNVPHRQLPGILNSADLFVLPSLYEGHPKTLIEAMACGLPVIGTDVPGIREIIQHGENGYLCGTSPEEIREAIRVVLGDSDRRVRMGQNAREFVVEHFALDRIVEKELAILEELTT